MTINELFELAWKLHWSKPRYMNSRWAIEVDRNYRRNIAPHFAQMQVSELTPKMLRHWLRDFEDRPYAGNRSLEALSKMYSIAMEEDIFNGNPCKGVKALPERSRDRYATDDEIARVLAALDKNFDRNPEASIYLLTLIYSGARPKSILNLDRSAVQIVSVQGEEWGRILINGKSTAESGEREIVMVPPKVLAMLKTLPGDRLFQMRFPRTFWALIREEAKVPDLWARDWRRTFATIGLSSGVKLDVIGELLNHQSTQTTKRYAKLDSPARADATRLIAEKINKLGAK